MEGDNKRPSSPVTRVYSELQRLLTPDQCDHIFPLINSVVTTNGMDDEDIAREQQERLYNESLMDVDQPSVAGATGMSYDARRLEEIEADAAFARRLQEEEYSKQSFVPSRSYQHKSNNEKIPAFIIDPDDEPQFTDAELAAQIQADEQRQQQQQRRQRSRTNAPSQRRISHQTANRTNEPEVIPFPFMARPTHQRPSSNDTNDLASFLRMFTPRGRTFPRGGRGTHALENSDRDFGPDDYENLLELDNSDGAKPLTSDQINRLPIEKFRCTANKNSEEDKCNICWDQFEQNDTLRRLPCLHRYHQNCIDPWLQRNNVCPICRNTIN